MPPHAKLSDFKECGYYHGYSSPFISQNKKHLLFHKYINTHWQVFCVVKCNLYRRPTLIFSCLQIENLLTIKAVTFYLKRAQPLSEGKIWHSICNDLSPFKVKRTVATGSYAFTLTYRMPCHPLSVNCIVLSCNTKWWKLVSQCLHTKQTVDAILIAKRKADPLFMLSLLRQFHLWFGAYIYNWLDL